jgi:hypothetical protein
MSASTRDDTPFEGSSSTDPDVVLEMRRLREVISDLTAELDRFRRWGRIS